MRRAGKRICVASILAVTSCILGMAFSLNTVTAENVSVVQNSYNFMNNVTKTDYDGVHYSAFDALSVNFPSTAASGIVNVKLPFETTDMAEENAAIRLRIQTMVPVTGRESLRFDLIGDSVMYMKANSLVYKEDKGKITQTTVGGNGSGAQVYVIDTAEVNGQKAFNGYVILPVSVWSDSVTGITGLNVRTNALYTKNIWNFGCVEYGSISENGEFNITKTLWTPFNSVGETNTFTADSSVDAALVKANTMCGTGKSFYLKTKLNGEEENTYAYSTTEYSGIKVAIDNTGNAARSLQFFIWDSTTSNLGSTTYSWQTKNGLAYFMPEDDCADFKNSSAYRSSFVPAGFKGEMYVPFTQNSVSEAGAWQATNANAGTDFPDSICNSIYVYTTCTETSFGIGTPSLVANGDAWLSEAFSTTASVNLGGIDDTKALMIQQKENVTSMQYELQPGNKGNVAFSSVNSANEVITGGSALAISVENLNEEPFAFQLTTYNQGNDRVVLGGNVAGAKVKFTETDGTVQYLDFAKGFVMIPGYAKGTLTLSYVGGTPAALSNCNYALGYPTGNIFRIYFTANKIAGAKFPVEYLVGDIAVVNGNGDATVLTVNGSSIISLATKDANYRIERSNIAYSGILKYSEVGFSETKGAAISVNTTKVRYNGEVVYTISDLLPWNGLVSAFLNGYDITEDLVKNGELYTYTTRLKENSTFSVMLAINDASFYYEGASIRVKNDDNGDGIRFSILMTKELYNSLLDGSNGKIEFGTLIIPKNMKNGELTEDTLYAKRTITNDILEEVNVAGVAYMRSVVYLWGIPESSYSRGFCARGYIRFGDIYFYTTEKEARSIAWVAQKAYADDKTSEAIKEGCLKYLPKVSFDLNGADGALESIVLYDKITYKLPIVGEIGITPPAGKKLAGYRAYGKMYSAGDEIIISGNVTLTFIWGEE